MLESKEYFLPKEVSFFISSLQHKSDYNLDLCMKKNNENVLI